MPITVKPTKAIATPRNLRGGDPGISPEEIYKAKDYLGLVTEAPIVNSALAIGGIGTEVAQIVAEKAEKKRLIDLGNEVALQSEEVKAASGQSMLEFNDLLEGNVGLSPNDKNYWSKEKQQVYVEEEKKRLKNQYDAIKDPALKAALGPIYHSYFLTGGIIDQKADEASDAFVKKNTQTSIMVEANSIVGTSFDLNDNRNDETLETDYTKKSKKLEALLHRGTLADVPAHVLLSVQQKQTAISADHVFYMLNNRYREVADPKKRLALIRNDLVNPSKDRPIKYPDGSKPSLQVIAFLSDAVATKMELIDVDQNLHNIRHRTETEQNDETYILNLLAPRVYTRDKDGNVIAKNITSHQIDLAREKRNADLYRQGQSVLHNSKVAKKQTAGAATRLNEIEASDIHEERLEGLTSNAFLLFKKRLDTRNGDYYNAHVRMIKSREIKNQYIKYLTPEEEYANQHSKSLVRHERRSMTERLFDDMTYEEYKLLVRQLKMHVDSNIEGEEKEFDHLFENLKLRDILYAGTGLRFGDLDATGLVNAVSSRRVQAQIPLIKEKFLELTNQQKSRSEISEALLAYVREIAPSSTAIRNSLKLSRFYTGKISRSSSWSSFLRKLDVGLQERFEDQMAQVARDYKKGTRTRLENEEKVIQAMLSDVYLSMPKTFVNEADALEILEEAYYNSLNKSQ